MEEKQFELHRIGYHFIHYCGVDIDRPRGTGDYLFLYLKSNVTIFTAEGEIQTGEPSFILYEKGFSQRYYDYQGPFINDWMHFDRQDAAEFFQKLDIPVNRLMIIQNSNDISSMMQDLRIEFKQQGKYHKEILDSKIKVMFYKFSDIYHEEIKFSDKLNRYRRDFNEVRNRIYNFTPDNMISGVNEIAASLNLSTSYFQHIYKQLFGVSVMNDIIKSRIEYACYLLSSNSDSISEIAFRCGYENKEHFTRQFKDITGYTPRQYREKDKSICICQMGERMVKLIASDLDGTLLLNGAREVSEKVIDYIKKLNQYGVVFAAASGRQYPNLKRLFGEVCEDIVYICENGAFVKYKGETLSKTPLDKKLGLEIMKDIYEKEDCEILLSGEETSYLMPKSEKYVDHMVNYVGNNITIIHDFEEVKEDYIKISVYEERGILHSSDYFYQKWGKKAKTTISGKCWLDFVAEQVNKGEALKNIQQTFHILKEDTMCFGDSYNDLEMFQNSLYSYAMTSANAEIRSCAKYVTTTVESILYDVYQVLSR